MIRRTRTPLLLLVACLSLARVPEAFARPLHPPRIDDPLSANAPTASIDRAEEPELPVATFSIVACDTAAGIWGVAVASKFFSVGSVVPWARGDVGAIATQAFANTTFGPNGLDLLEHGANAQETLEILLRQDLERERRQVGVVDAQGGSATFTGKDCMAWAGGKTGPGYSAQGNILTGPEVVDAIALTFEGTEGYLGNRLLAALEAGERTGGDSRGRQSAALRLAAVGQGYGGFNDILCDLRVDDSADPIAELKRLYGIWRPTQLITEGYRLLDEGRYDEAIARGEEAAKLDPDSGEPYYHLACYYSRSGDAKQALHYLEWALRLDPALKKQAATDTDLAPLHDDPEYQRILGTEQ